MQRVEFHELEHITTLQVVELESKETASGRKLFIAIGTAYMRSEELTVRGRVRICDYEVLTWSVTHIRCD